MSNLMLLKGGVGARVLSASALPQSSSIVAYWRLEEATNATRVDATSRGNDLADGLSVVQTTGKINNGALFAIASSQFLNLADNADLSLGGGNFTISCWAKLTSNATTRIDMFVGKSNQAGADYGYFLGAREDNQQIFFGVGYGDNSNQKVNIWGGIAFGTGWHHYVAVHDQTNSLDYLYYDGVSQGSLANANGSRNDTAQFRLGAVVDYNFGAGSRQCFLGGTLDEVCLWKGVALNSSEVSTVYNGGSGLGY